MSKGEAKGRREPVSPAAGREGEVRWGWAGWDEQADELSRARADSDAAVRGEGGASEGVEGVVSEAGEAVVDSEEWRGDGQPDGEYQRDGVGGNVGEGRGVSDSLTEDSSLGLGNLLLSGGDLALEGWVLMIPKWKEVAGAKHGVWGFAFYRLGDLNSTAS